MYDLVFHRVNGTYRTDVVGPNEFVATIAKVDGEWHLTTTTFGRELTSERYLRLNSAKASAGRTLYAIGG